VLTERLARCSSRSMPPPAVRAAMLRNPKGATSLRWLRSCSRRIEVHGRSWVPGVNDGAVLTIPRRHPRRVPGLTTIGSSPRAQPLLQRGEMAHTVAERPVCDAVEQWQGLLSCSAADGLRATIHLLANRPFPPASATRASPSTRTASAWCAPSKRPSGQSRRGARRPHGFFASVDGAGEATGERAPGALRARPRRRRRRSGGHPALRARVLSPRRRHPRTESASSSRQ